MPPPSIEVVDKQATIYLNGQRVYGMRFKNDFGKVVGIVYNFAGTGMVDDVRLMNGEGVLVLDEGF